MLWTDDAQLVFLSVDRDRLALDRRYSPELDSVLVDSCLYCHHFGQTHETDFAPSLSGLMGRPIASDRFRYSAGLRSVQGEWDPETLRQFLADPGQGTRNRHQHAPNAAWASRIRRLVREFARMSQNRDQSDANDAR